MPVMVRDPERRDAFRDHLSERHGVQTSVFYPAIHEFTAYRERFPGVSPAAHGAGLPLRGHDPALPAHDRRGAGSRLHGDRGGAGGVNWRYPLSTLPMPEEDV